MTKKIKYLIVLNVVLLGAISFSLKTKAPTSSLNTLDTQFALADSASVNRIVLGKNTFTKQESGAWRINDSYAVDDRRMVDLLTILQRIGIKRPASDADKAAVQAAITQEGLMAQFSDESGEQAREFKMVERNGETFAILGSADPYIIHTPGVDINLAEWLTAPEATWRDRRVIYTTWRTLKKLEVKYWNDTNNSFQISFDNNFYNVSGVDKLDSTAVYDYLVQFQEFRAANFVVNRPQLADSLTQKAPLCTITVEDLYEDRNNSLLIYPTEEEIIYGVLAKNKEVVQLAPRVLQSVMVGRDRFRKKE